MSTEEANENFEFQDQGIGNEEQGESPQVIEDGESSSILLTPQYDDIPLRYRNLSEIYKRCHLCIFEPECYDEAALDKA